MKQKKSNIRTLKGSSLFYAIVLTMLISMVSVSIISMSYFQNVELEIYTSSSRLIENCNSAQAILLSEHQEKEEYKRHVIYELEDSTSYMIKPWGVWKAGTVSSKRRNEEISNEFLFGTRWNDDNVAIKVKNGIGGLAIGGFTELVGDAQVPGGRIKPAYIEGQSFNGNQLIDGTVTESGRLFPQLSPKFKAKLNAPSDKDSIVPFYSSEEVISRSFAKNTLVLSSSDSIAVLKKELSGNIIIKSNRAVYISPFSELNNVLIMAPRIYIGSGVEGSMQCIATQNIIVEESVSLSYPSSLIMIADKLSESEVEISKDCLIEGVVSVLENAENQLKPQLKISPNSTVKGQVYCQGSTELRGVIEGQLFSYDIHLKTASAFYKNHLLNAKINVKNLPNWFSGLAFTNRKATSTKVIDL